MNQAVLYAFGIADVCFLITILFGIGASLNRQRFLFLHRLLGWATAGFTLLALLITENMLSHEGRGNHGFLFWIHLLIFAFPFLISLIVQIKRNGIKNKIWHRRVGWASLLFCIGMNITGYIMMTNRHV